MVTARKTAFQKRRLILVSLTALLLLTAVTFLNIRLGRTARQVVKDQFNEAQLVVARNVNYWIEREIHYLGKELRLAARDIGDAEMEPQAAYDTLQPYFERVVEIGVNQIELFDKQRDLKYTFYAYEKTIKTTSYIFPFIPKSLNESDINQPVYISKPAGNGPEMYVKISIMLDNPIYEGMSFHLNLSWFLTPYLQSIRSGKTGYAWVIDSRGIFLYHPQPAFLGRSAFEARRDREPDISHHLINTIQRDNMLKGLEGTGFYHSGWHRGITGKTEKLIAFSPVVISDAPHQFWSVAVVAPVFEIEDTLRGILRWQVILQGLSMLLLVAAAGAVLVFEVRWSDRLEKTVKARTLELERSEEKYRSLVESAEDFIFTLDHEGKLLSVNSFTAGWFGSRPEELIGLGVEHLFPQGVAQRQVEIVKSVFQNGKSVRDEFELTVGLADTWISANFMPLKNEAGRTTAVLCIARDITENKRLERHLINTEKLASLGTLAAGVAHEINNPLGVMLGFCDLLVRKKKPGSQEYEDLKIIERQGLHCKQVVQNLLSFARVGREVSTHTDVNDCLREILKVVSHSLEMNGIDLHVRLCQDLPRVMGDHRQVQQVFLNLINNAGAAMPEGGLLTIQTDFADSGKKVAIRVQDRGAGIPAEVMDHIFDPFFTTKPEGEGTGLGLFVSYGIINKFGGSISCRSQTDDAGKGPTGTTFEVVLPVSKEAYEWRAESLS